MSSGFAAWLAHPVTLAIATVAVAALFVVIELLLRSLSQLGNVRFQGILEEHPELFDSDTTVHVSRLIDVLRWLQLGCLGLLWFLVFRFPGLRSWAAFAAAVVLPLLLVLVTRAVVRPLSEDAVTVLLGLVRPLAAPMVGAIVNAQPELPAPAAEDDEEESAPVRSNRLFVALWVVITAGLSVYAIINPGFTGLDALAADTEEDLTIEVSARQWAWDYTYVDYDLTIDSGNDLVVCHKAQDNTAAAGVQFCGGPDRGKGATHA